MIHDDKTRELIERYCSGLDRNIVLSRSIGDKRCICLNHEQCKMSNDCKYGFQAAANANEKMIPFN